jgi:hypothetical protein
MKYLLLNILFLLLSICSYGQASSSREGSEGIDSSVEVELITDADTLASNQPFQLYLVVKNKSKKPIFVPKEIDIVSDLYPNGTKGPWDGAVVHLEIDSLPLGASIFYEITTVSNLIIFEKIKPNSSIKLPLLDLSEYLADFNNHIDSEDLKIKSGRTYRLKVKYSNGWKKKGNEEKTFTGSVASNVKEVYIK